MTPFNRHSLTADFADGRGSTRFTPAVLIRGHPRYPRFSGCVARLNCSILYLWFRPQAGLRIVMTDANHWADVLIRGIK